MVIDLQHVVGIIVLLIVAAAVFGLLYFLIHRVGSKFPGETSAMFVNIADIVLIVFAVLLLIGLLLSFAGVGPEFWWGAPAVR